MAALSGERCFLAVPVFCCFFFFFSFLTTRRSVENVKKMLATQLCENGKNAEITLVSQAWIFK